MTFSKPLFNGVEVDFASDKHQATVLMSRLSEPNAVGGSQDQRTNAANLVGARLVSQVGDFVRVGGTFVSAYHAHTQREPVAGDLFRGSLTESQNLAPVTLIELALTDDSPEDNRAGAALFASDIVVTSADGDLYRGPENGFRPQVEGGFQRLGYLAADGVERMVVRYDLKDVAYTGPDPADVERVEVELVLANDYRVEVASDRQSNRRGETVFLPLARAGGNPDDGSDQRVLAFDHGLPTANQIDRARACGRRWR